jgi:hypothetical protein
MRRLGWLVLTAAIAAAPIRAFTPQETPATTEAADAPAAAPASLARPVDTVSELMVQVVYPTSDAVFYIETRTPETEAGWIELQAKLLVLAESANLLMMPGRAKDQDKWMKDAKLMLDAGTAAYRAARRRDVAAITAASEPLLTSCITCHQDYRPTYRRRLP